MGILVDHGAYGAHVIVDACARLPPCSDFLTGLTPYCLSLLEGV
jgi:hypothetical protein